MKTTLFIIIALVIGAVIGMILISPDDVPDNVPDVPDNVPDVPDNVPDVPDNVPDVPDNVFCTELNKCKNELQEMIDNNVGDLQSCHYEGRGRNYNEVCSTVPFALSGFNCNLKIFSSEPNHISGDCEEYLKVPVSVCGLVEFAEGYGVKKQGIYHIQTSLELEHEDSFTLKEPPSLSSQTNKYNPILIMPNGDMISFDRPEGMNSITSVYCIEGDLTKPVKFNNKQEGCTQTCRTDVRVPVFFIDNITSFEKTGEKCGEFIDKYYENFATMSVYNVVQSSCIRN